jgi:thiazole/oxazole-forming peptide maturase SagD family component
MSKHHELSERSSYIQAHSWASGVEKKSFYAPHPHFSDSSTPKKTYCPDGANGFIVTQKDPQLYATKNLLETLRQDGFIRHYGEGPIFNDYPKFHYVGINYIIDKDASAETQLAWGYCLPDGDVETAFSKALGESLERQASYYLPNLSSAKFPRIKSGDASWLYPLIPHFTDAQLNNNDLLVQTGDDLLHCQGFYAKSLTGDKKRFFPFETFYWGSVVDPDQKIAFHHTTSGSGGGLTRDQALVSGWNELIERDHLLLYWFSGIPPKRIAVASLPAELKEYIDRTTRKYNLEIYFLDLHHDINMSVGACVIIDPVLHRISMGAKAGFNGVQVLESSLLEALAVLSSTRSRDRAVSESELKDIISGTPFTNKVLRSDRVNLYASAYGNELMRTSFLCGEDTDFTSFDANATVNLTNYSEQLEYLKTAFGALVEEYGPGYHAYFHEYESVWLDRLHYHAAHVFIPSLLKLHLNETLATPVSKRLYEFAEIHGKKDFGAPKINPLPHFFP